jgi:predicted phosphate transport protein (TIGR00153 family)
MHRKKKWTIHMPGSPLFTRLFGRSPIAPLQDHMKVSAECAGQLLSYFEAVYEEDWDKAKSVYDSIGALEQEADEMKREIRINLPKSLFLPVSRSDLLELLHNQDRIPNRAKDIAGLILGRQMSMPEPIRKVMLEYITVSVSATSFALKALEELDELVESGFSGREMDLIEKLVDSLGDVEHESDIKQIEVRSRLMSVERDLDPIDVMFMYRIIEWIGDLADDSQTVGNRMLYLIAR